MICPRREKINKKIYRKKADEIQRSNDPFAD